MTLISGLPEERRMQLMCTKLDKNCEVFVKTSEEIPGKPKLEYLEAVAMTRCILVVASDILADLVSPDGEVKDDLTQEKNRLMEFVKKVCCEATINTLDAGPGVFLLRQIFKRSGSDCLKALARFFPWILPKDLISNVSAGSK